MATHGGKKRMCRGRLVKSEGDDSVTFGKWWCCVPFSGNHILEGTLVLQYEQGRLSDSFWTFTIDRQHSFHFYPTNKLWDPPQHKANSIIREFENSIDLEDHLSMFSMGDFNNCHNMFLKLWKDVPSKLLSRLSWGNIHSVGKAWSSAEKSDDFLCGCQYVYIMGKFGRLRQCFSGGLLLWRSLVITRVPLSHLISHRFSFPINQCHDIKWTLLDQQSVCITLNIQAFPIVCYSCPLHQSKHHVWRCHCFRLAQLSTTSCVNHSKYVTLLDGSVDILFLW